MRGLLAVSVLAVSLGGCAYNAPVAINPNLNVYSSYGDKLPGRFLVYIEGEKFNQIVKATGLACGAHTYPLDAREAFRQSTLKTLQNLVEDAQIVAAPVPVADLAAQGANGMISVVSDSFSPRFVAIEGFWEGTIDANVSAAASITVDTPRGRQLGTTGEGDGNAQSGSGGACEGATIALGKATEEAIKELIGQLGERMVNSQRLREDLAPRGTKGKRPSS